MRRDIPTFMDKKRSLLVVAAFAASVLVWSASPATSAVKTTAPGQTYVIKLTLTNKAIVIPKDKYSKGQSGPTYPRGGSVQYDIFNKGSHPYAIKIGSRTTPVITPGHSTFIQLHWTYRGRYLYETLYQGKPLGPKGYITIF